MRSNSLIVAYFFVLLAGYYLGGDEGAITALACFFGLAGVDGLHMIARELKRFNDEKSSS